MFILWFFIMLIILVLVHELGHFAMAKAFGVTVEEFGVFMPPRIFGIRKGETIYSLNALPLGGFCRMSGEIDPQEVSRMGTEKRVWGKKAVGKDGQPFKTVTLASKSGIKRVLVLGAGSIMNLILPVFLIMIALMIPHLISTDTGDVYVDTVLSGSPAQAAGIKSGDIIQSLNGVTLTKNEQYSSIIAANLGKELGITIKHSNGQIVNSTIIPNSDSVPTTGANVSNVSPEGGVLVDSVISNSYAQALGIVAGDRITAFAGTDITSVQQYNDLVTQNLFTQVDLTVVHQNGKTATISLEPSLYPGPTGVTIGTGVKKGLTFVEAVPQSFVQYWNIVLIFKNGIAETIKGTIPFQVSGPVGIAQATGEVARLGIAPLLMFAALISINLGIVNILPLPALDGGRVFFVLLEWIRGGKKVSPKTENLVHTIGFLALIGLMLLATYGDISRIISGTSLIP